LLWLEWGYYSPISILCLLVALFVYIPVQKCNFRDKFCSGLLKYCHLDTNCVMGCPKFWFQVLHPFLHTASRFHALSIVDTYGNLFQLFVTNGLVWHLLINSSSDIHWIHRIKTQKIQFFCHNPKKQKKKKPLITVSCGKSYIQVIGQCLFPKINIVSQHH
jgi:hypothetical protein